MWPDRVSNPGPLTFESGPLPTALRSPAGRVKLVLQQNCIELIYTRGQVSVNKRISVLSNYFDVSFEIYYVRLKYIDSIGQVVKLLILRPASICCTFNSGHIGSHAPNVNKMGCSFYFHTSRVRLKHKYLFRS